MTVNGSNFLSVTQVNVGSQLCGNLQIQSDTQLTCTAPAHSAIEYQDVSVTNWGGSATLSSSMAYAMVLGHSTLTDESNAATGGLEFAKGISVHGNYFFVADSDSHRVLIYNSIPTSNFQTPDLILGQPGLNSVISNFGGVSAQSMHEPYIASYDGTRLFVVDQGNNRVLIYNSLPTVSFASADLVLGQPNMSSSAANNGGISGSSLNNPSGVFSDGTHLVVADTNNSRVLIWNSIPTSNGQAADLVLGQPDMLHSSANNGPNTVACGSSLGRNSCSLSYPTGVLLQSGALYVSDSSNNRVLIWNSIPTTTQQAANVVLGQALFTTGSANNGPNTVACGGAAGTNACSFSSPGGISSDGTRLAVTDYYTNRVLVWNTLPVSNQTPASFALGQATLLTKVSGLTSQALNNPLSVALSATALFVSDHTNNRVLGWSPLPAASNTAANLVLGQTSFTVNNFNNPGAPLNASELGDPQAVSWDGTHLIVASRTHNRTLIWNSLPTTPDQSADVILGQPDTSSYLINNGPNTVACGGAAGVNACSQADVFGLQSDGTHLFISDYMSNRVLVWNSIPTTDNQPADLVLGQPTFTASTASNGPNTVACGGSAGANACSMNGPRGVFSDGTRLAVADTGGSRVLFWNSIPTSTQQNASIVLGQSTVTGQSANNGPNTVACGGAAGLNACSLNGPSGVLIAASHLLVSDAGNNRILIWNTIPTATGQAANVVLGQTNFFANASNNGGISAGTLNDPAELSWDGTHLYVSDQANQRVLVWNGIPTSNGQLANAVFGQASFTTSGTGLPPISGSTMNWTFGIASDASRLFISESHMDRVTILPTSK